jgi:hypothetical protein
MRHSNLCAASTVLALTAVAACVPPFSELQSARTLGPGRSEITASYSFVHPEDEPEDLAEQRNIAVHVGLGLAPSTDLRIRLERMSARESDADESVTAYVLAAGPKFGLVPDRLALFVPVGFAFGDDIDAEDTFQIHPTLIGTLPLASGLDLNGSAKVLVPITGEGDNLIAFNVGLGIGEGIRRWVIRPEIGMLMDPGEAGRYWQVSLGLSYQTRRE